MATICEPTLSVLKEKQKIILDRIYRHHLRLWGGSEGKVFFISDLYHGVWLEHTYDAVAWANYMPSDHEISKNQVKLFLSKQKPDGQLPCYIWADKIGYSQTQECVSFTRLALEACGQNADDPDFLVQCYEACKKWDEWLCAARMPHKKGLIEMFCGFDTGHDNSGRLRDMKYPNLYSKDGAAMPDDDPVLPVLAPDMNAVFYGDRMALADMADKLGKADEAAIWRKKAEEVRQAIFEYCASPSLTAILVELHHKLQQYRKISISRPGRTADAVSEHKGIFEAIANRDAKAAEKLMVAHIQNAYTNIQTYYEKESSSWE